MSVYNGAPHVGQAIESVLNDDYDDFEFVIVNDGSTDETGNILARYAGEFPRIRVLEQKNSGLTRSLNKALSTAAGQYIARLDADDYALPGRLETQAGYLDRHDEVVLIGANANLVNETDSGLGRTTLGELSHAQCESRLETMASFFPHSSWMARRQVLLDLGGYDEFFKKAQDYELLLRVIRKGRIGCLSEFLVAIRKSESSATYDSKFWQYKYAVVARLSHHLRLQGEVQSLPDNELLLKVVEKWFLGQDLSRAMLAQRHLSFARNAFLGGAMRKCLKNVALAVRADPLFIIRMRRLKNLRQTPLPTLFPYLKGCGVEKYVSESG